MASTHGMQTRSRSQPPVEDGGDDVRSITENTRRALVVQKEIIAKPPATEIYTVVNIGNNGSVASRVRARIAMMPLGEELSRFTKERLRTTQRKV